MVAWLVKKFFHLLVPDVGCWNLLPDGNGSNSPWSGWFEDWIMCSAFCRTLFKIYIILSQGNLTPIAIFTIFLTIKYVAHFITFSNIKRSKQIGDCKQLCQSKELLAGEWVSDLIIRLLIAGINIKWRSRAHRNLILLRPPLRLQAPCYQTLWICRSLTF